VRKKETRENQMEKRDQENERKEISLTETKPKSCGLSSDALSRGSHHLFS